MESNFVPYQQASALKELGFDEPCFGKYDIYGSFDHKLFYHNHDSQTSLNCAAPLYSQAFRWFREKHNLVFNFISYNIVKPGEYHWSITWNDEAKASGIVKTYEEAEQACLDKLIEICKEQQHDK
jgi:hypothetical protein